MKKQFHYLIIFYIFFICSKTIIAKLLINTFGFKYAFDIISIFIILLNICITIHLLTRNFKLLKIEFFILLSLLVPYLLTLITNGFQQETIVHVITMLKFYPLVFIWRYIDNDFILKISKYLKTICLLEIFIGLLQSFGGEKIYNFFVPVKRYNQIASVLPQDFSKWNGDIFGTFEVQIAYSYFIFFTFVLCNNLFKNKLNKFLYFIFSFTVIFLSGSTMIILAFLLYFSILFFSKYKIKKFIIFLFITVFSLSVFLFYWEIIFDYFSIAYESNRLGIILNLVPDFFRNQNITNMLFGYGCEDGVIQKKIFSSLNIPTIFLADENTTALQDVYIVAHVFYFGFFGVIMFFFMIQYWIKYFSKGQFQDENHLLIIIYLLIPLLFVNQFFNIEVGNFFVFLIIGILIFLKKNYEKVYTLN